MIHFEDYATAGSTNTFPGEHISASTTYCLHVGRTTGQRLLEGKLHSDQSAAHSPPPSDPATADRETSPSIRLTPSLATLRLPICTSAADVSVTPSSGSPQGACEHSRPLRARSTEGNRKGEARGGEGGRGGRPDKGPFSPWPEHANGRAQIKRKRDVNVSLLLPIRPQRRKFEA